MVVELLLKLYQISSSGYDRLKFTINIYHTNTRIMVNWRQASHFNAEHSKISDFILASEQGADLDRELFNCTEEESKSLSVDKSQNQIQARQMPMCRQKTVDLNIP